MAESLNVGDIVFVPERLNSAWTGNARVIEPSVKDHKFLSQVVMLSGHMKGSWGYFSTEGLVMVSPANDPVENLRKAVEAVRATGLGVECIVREEVVVKDVKETRL